MYFVFFLFFLFALIPVLSIGLLIRYVIRKRNATQPADIREKAQRKLDELKAKLKPWTNQSFEHLSPHPMITSIDGVSMNRRHGYLLGSQNERQLALSLASKAAFEVDEFTVFAHAQADFQILTKRKYATFSKDGIPLGSYTFNEAICDASGQAVGELKIKLLNGLTVDDRENFHFHFQSGLKGYMPNISNITTDGLIDYSMHGSHAFEVESGHQPTDLEKDLLLCLWVLLNSSSWTT